MQEEKTSQDDFPLQLRKTNKGIDSFKNLISDVVETDRFYTFLETFRKDAEDQTLWVEWPCLLHYVCWSRVTWSVDYLAHFRLNFIRFCKNESSQSSTFNHLPSSLVDYLVKLDDFVLYFFSQDFLWFSSLHEVSWPDGQSVRLEISRLEIHSHSGHFSFFCSHYRVIMQHFSLLFRENRCVTTLIMAVKETMNTWTCVVLGSPEIYTMAI